MYPALTGQANVSPAHGVSGATLDRVLVVLVLDEVTLRGNVKTALVARKPDKRLTHVNNLNVRSPTVTVSNAMKTKF